MFGFKRFVVEGESMLPMFKSGDRVVVNTKSKPKEGDVVVVQRPHSEQLLVKRITKVTDTQYLVEGDNGEYSTDSRTFGRVTREDILGKVVLRY